MQPYQHILIAADFSEHGELVAARARDLAERYQARLSLLHVVDNLPVTDSIYGPIIPFDTDITEQLIAASKEKLDKMGETLGVPPERRWVEVGSPKVEIVRVAEEEGVDLIVVGSHSRRGLGTLLGSTASSVILHAKCDVLAVRLKED
ncbi:universal stress protein A [Methylomarinovum caldicuralii]|uniref:Universal stress protein n=1 Tax=Methylomarinovum caldicuralii TaxID=438856 RepID=A0AAU9C081_9GAMM|nr:universal stress protein [Methylomarinovum caldicuralii]BCX80439.1 universal stress protein A [Methylomarinovum caldicuralii]